LALGPGPPALVAGALAATITLFQEEVRFNMIARIWHGTTPAAKADDYLALLQRTGIPDYQATPGNQGVFVLRRLEGEAAHFLLISLWSSMEAIAAFAGAEVEQARYYPEDPDFLLELEPQVTHYEVLLRPEPPPAARP
jgi:heme-degrading monooxygenase HmoA